MPVTLLQLLQEKIFSDRMRQLHNDLLDLRNINLRIVKKEKNVIEQANKSCNTIYIFKPQV